MPRVGENQAMADFAPVTRTKFSVDIDNDGRGSFKLGDGNDGVGKASNHVSIETGYNDGSIKIASEYEGRPGATILYYEDGKLSGHNVVYNTTSVGPPISDYHQLDAKQLKDARDILASVLPQATGTTAAALADAVRRMDRTAHPTPAPSKSFSSRLSDLYNYLDWEIRKLYGAH
jgi:hypothetical protein